jgi:hypothetical protein
LKTLYNADGTPRNTFDVQAEWLAMVTEAFQSNLSGGEELNKDEFRHACVDVSTAAGLIFNQTEEDFEKTFEDADSKGGGDGLVDFDEFVGACKRLELNFQSYWTTAMPNHTERWWYPFVIHIEPTYWWFFLTELAEKSWINYLYLRGQNSDENFNWKLAVCIHLLFDYLVKSTLRPRLYKQARDVQVDNLARIILITMLVLGMSMDRMRLLDGTATIAGSILLTVAEQDTCAREQIGAKSAFCPPDMGLWTNASAVLGIRAPRNCFWAPKNTLCTKSLYKVFLGVRIICFLEECAPRITFSRASAGLLWSARSRADLHLSFLPHPRVGLAEVLRPRFQPTPRGSGA